MTTTITRDILTIEKGIIVHQVNCQGVMGAGLAKKIADKWPVVKEEYVKECRTGLHRVGSLGALLLVKVTPTLLVGNVFGQLSYGRDKCHTCYWALATVFHKLALQRTGPLPLYIPHGIGCGLAGGDWRVVSALIEQELPDAVICRWPDPQFTAPLPKTLVQR